MCIRDRFYCFAFSSKSSQQQQQQQQIRTTAAEISHSFPTSEFVPQFWFSNNHIQTITGFFARNRNLALTQFQWDTREKMKTSDNENYFSVDYKFVEQPQVEQEETQDPPPPLVLICHGLQSNSKSPLVKDMAIAFNKIGMNVACIHFRGCCDEPNMKSFGYHLSFTDDLEFMVQHISSTQPKTRLYLSGFSLGANVVTKFLADIGTDATIKYNICGAAVNAVPFDLVPTAPNMNTPTLTKFLYGDRLLKSIQESAIEALEMTKNNNKYSYTPQQVMECQTINEIEDLVVCPEFGFQDWRDYYTQSSTLNILDKVSVPQLVVQALDDPFFKGNTNPPNDKTLPLRIHYTETGGHCGYTFYSKPEELDGGTWMTRELARFLKHVEDLSLIHI